MDRFESHTRAFIKVEDGCNRRCAYCIIPKARGPVRSRAEASVLDELRQLAAAGYREVVLSAISLPSYGTDTGTNLYELIEHCAQVEGIERIRLGSLDPDMLTEDGIRRLAAVDKLCPQFHLSLQSGCDATLRRMRRPYTAAQYLDIVGGSGPPMRAAGSALPPTASAASPGRPRRTLRPAAPSWSRWAFLRVHVFPYSRREGTPAFGFPDQVHEREKQRRSRAMHLRAEAVREKVLAGLEGTEDEVLLETPVSATLFTRLHPAVCACVGVGAGVPVGRNCPGAAGGNTTAPGSAHSSWERKNEPAGAFVIFLTLFCLLPFSSRVKCDKMDLYERRRAEGFSAPARRKNPGRRPHCPTRFSAKQRRVLE